MVDHLHGSNVSRRCDGFCSSGQDHAATAAVRRGVHSRVEVDTKMEHRPTGGTGHAWVVEHDFEIEQFGQVVHEMLTRVCCGSDVALPNALQRSWNEHQLHRKPGRGGK